jgi:vacuolar-type H+-ATPase subunit C/Vma6
MGQDFPSWAIEEIQTLVRAKLKNEEQEYRQLLIFCLVEI